MICISIVVGLVGIFVVLGMAVDKVYIRDWLDWLDTEDEDEDD